MAITTVGTPHVYASSTAVASVTNNVPTGVADGDLLVWVVAYSDSVVQSVPTGWTLLRSVAIDGTTGFSSWYRIASSEPSSYTLTLSSTLKASSSMHAYRGVSSSPVYDIILANTTASSSVRQPAAGTSVTDGAWFIGISVGRLASGVTSNTWSSSNMNVEVSNLSTQASVTNVTYGLFNHEQSTAGLFTPAVSTANAVNPAAATRIVLRPVVVVIPNGSGSGTYNWTGVSVGATTHDGTGTGAYVWAGAAVGENVAATFEGTAAGSFDWSGSIIVGDEPVIGEGSSILGTFDWTGVSAVGRVPTLDIAILSRRIVVPRVHVAPSGYVPVYGGGGGGGSGGGDDGGGGGGGGGGDPDPPPEPEPDPSPPPPGALPKMGVSNSSYNHGGIASWNAMRVYDFRQAIGVHNETGCDIICLTDRGTSLLGGASSANALGNFLADFYAGSSRDDVEIHFANGNEYADNVSTSQVTAFVNTCALMYEKIHARDGGGDRIYPKASMWLDPTQNQEQSGIVNRSLNPAAPYLDGVAWSMYPPGRQQEPDPVFTDWVGSPARTADFLKRCYVRTAAVGVNKIACWEVGIGQDPNNRNHRPYYAAHMAAAMLEYADQYNLTMPVALWWDSTKGGALDPQNVLSDEPAATSPSTAQAWKFWRSYLPAYGGTTPASWSGMSGRTGS